MKGISRAWWARCPGVGWVLDVRILRAWMEGKNPLPGRIYRRASK